MTDEEMVTRWTMAQVEEAAPDAKAVAAARKLASPGPWSDTGSTDTLVWGKCQGSGSTPYQVSVDLTGPAFKCTCPSRKFPCKHGLALLMLWVSSDGSVADVDAPADFAAAWQAGRQQKAVARTAKAADAPPTDPAAQARRLARRVELMTAGLDDFESWLHDLVSHGLAAARQRPYSWWDTVAARLVDAQVPGLAERVRDMGGAVHRRDDWPDHLLEEIGRWALAIRAWRRRDELDPDALGDLRTFLGWAIATDDIRGGEQIADTWAVLGVHRDDTGRLQAQRTWLLGHATGNTVLVLDFAASGGPLRVAQTVGTLVEATVTSYPGSTPLRVLLPDIVRPAGTVTEPPLPVTIGEAFAQAATALAANPFVDRIPVVLGPVRVATDESGTPGVIVDANGDALPLAAGTDVWRLLATTAGRPTTLFGELESGSLRVLTIAATEGMVPQ